MGWKKHWKSFLFKSRQHNRFLSKKCLTIDTSCIISSCLINVVISNKISNYNRLDGFFRPCIQKLMDLHQITSSLPPKSSMNGSNRLSRYVTSLWPSPPAPQCPSPSYLLQLNFVIWMMYSVNRFLILPLAAHLKINLYHLGTLTAKY